MDIDAGLQSPMGMDDFEEHSEAQSDSGYFGDALHVPPTAAQSRPHTPRKLSTSNNAPQYPYTPDSARMPMRRSRTLHDGSPLPSMPWDSSPPLHRVQTSPVQSALFSCLNNLEHLIQTSQPDHAQMEYIISQFEAMTSYLSAPEAQTKQSDDHLFSELENSFIVEKSRSLTKEEAEAYVAAVGEYIEGVERHHKDMKMRFEEVKELNGIQFEIIADLQQQLRAKTEQAIPRAAVSEPIKSKTPEAIPQRKGFWSSIGEALDQVGEMLYEW